MAPRFGLEAHVNAQKWPLIKVIEELREILGARLVAYLGGVKETRAVTDWITEKHRPSSEAVEQRLRDAYQIAALLAEVEGKGVVQTWFMGMNPQLDDRSPARLLREGGPEAGTEVLGAARAFIAMAS